MAAVPASNALATRARVDSVTSGIARRDLSTLQGVLGNVSAIVSPLLTDLSMCKHFFVDLSGADIFSQPT